MIHEKELSDKIIGCAIRVHKELGPGYLEKVYERALLIELNSSGIDSESQVPIQIMYKDEVVGDYIADIIVQKKVILEIKACAKINPMFEAQLTNYLIATKIRIGYVLNFGSMVLEFVRRIK